jgi:hypothetical protein
MEIISAFLQIDEKNRIDLRHLGDYLIEDNPLF